MPDDMEYEDTNVAKTKRSWAPFTAGLILVIALSAQPAARANDLEKQVPSEAALKTKMALKLAGLVTFVAGSCPAIKTDYPRFKVALGALGVSYEDLTKIEMKTIYLGYALRYKDDTKENCARAIESFGPGGKTVPDVFKVSKAP